LTRSLALTRSNELPVDVTRVPAAAFCQTPVHWRLTQTPYSYGSNERTEEICVTILLMESTEAILLRKRKFSDTSLIVSWCTESLGCVQTIAKGARRLKSAFAGKLDLFFEAEISLVRSRKSDLHTLTEVVLKNPFAGIRSNYLRTQTAAYFVELIEICTERDHREPELFGLLRRAFGYLDANDPTSRAVAHFETELARIAGVHDKRRLKADPAFALGDLFGRLPLSRTPLLKTLATKTKNISK
jgi:DNA repair protein RecO (recombination protein O)